jgi:hypothetical protein
MLVIFKVSSFNYEMYLAEILTNSLTLDITQSSSPDERREQGSEDDSAQYLSQLNSIEDDYWSDTEEPSSEIDERKLSSLRAPGRNTILTLHRILGF